MTDGVTSPHGFLCPGCRCTLHPAAVPDGVLTGCADCGGMWIDNRASQAAVRGALSPAARAFIHRVTTRVPPKKSIPNGGYRDAPAPTTRACPECGDALTARKIPDPPVVVDVCLAHGTYFDRGELSQIAEHVDAQAWARYREAQTAAWQAQYSTGDSGVDQLVYDFSSVLRTL